MYNNQYFNLVLNVFKKKKVIILRSFIQGDVEHLQ